MSRSRKRKEIVEEQNPVLTGPPHDAIKFKSRKAEDFFIQSERKKCNAEREFDFEDLGLDDIVERYQWRTLASKPRSHGVALHVKEFYANVHELGNCGESYVRGRPVNYSSEMINHYFSMANVDECKYTSTLGEMEKEWKKEIHVIQSTFGRVPINLNNGGRLMPVKKLRHRLRYLHRFISERILPSGHKHEVHWRRAWLMHLVLKGESINTGLIISNQIAQNASKVSNVNFNFPCLITHLISRAGVNLPTKDLKPGPKIDLSTLTKKSHIQSGEAVSEGSDEENSENEGEEAGNDEDIGDPEDEILELYRRDPASGMHALSLTMSSVRVEVNEMNRKFEHLNNRFEVAEQSRIDEATAAQIHRDMQIAEAKAAQAHRELQDSRWEQLMGRLPPQGIDWQQFVSPQSHPQTWQFQQFQGGDWDHHFRPPPQ